MAIQAYHPRFAAHAFLGAIVLLVLAGCGSTAPPPVAEISAAQTAVTAAEQADAAQHAPADLDRARDKLLRAQVALQEDENVQARRLAQQASVDARLAEAKTRAGVAQQNADQVQFSIDALRSQVMPEPRPLVGQ